MMANYLVGQVIPLVPYPLLAQECRFQLNLYILAVPDFQVDQEDPDHPLARRVLLAHMILGVQDCL